MSKEICHGITRTLRSNKSEASKTNEESEFDFATSGLKSSRSCCGKPRLSGVLKRAPGQVSNLPERLSGETLHGNHVC